MKSISCVQSWKMSPWSSTAAWSITGARWAGKQVVVCCAGMGKANAAATTQVLITRYGAEKIIFSGIAGNMTSKIGIGDVVIGKTVLYHDAQLDMICQNPPYLKEYTGDPALIAAAEKPAPRPGSRP